MVTPSYMLAILDELERQGVDPSTCSLKVGIFGAEPWTDGMRREIEERLDMHAVDIYGLSEVIGPGVANECVETKDGLHIWEDHFYPEVIDPETGRVLPDGEPGELVFTSLTKEALPIIRYRTRDLTRLLPGTARTMRRMEKVNRLDELTVRVEARPGAAGAEERKRSGQELASLIKHTIGVSVAVTVLEPDLIERSAGKAQRVVDLRETP
jgi:phenylacetate-CoA ligase